MVYGRHRFGWMLCNGVPHEISLVVLRVVILKIGIQVGDVLAVAGVVFEVELHINIGVPKQREKV